MIENIRLGNGALSNDTELLTPIGWLNIIKVTKETLVAQYSKDGYVNFTQPIYIRLEKPKKAIHIHNKERHYDQLIGIDHAVPYVSTYSNSLRVTPANRVTRNLRRKYLHTGALLGGFITILSTLDRLKIAFQGDGCISRCGISVDYIRFNFAKERKIERLHGLLKAANINYKTLLLKCGQTQFTFSSPTGFYDKNFDWVDLSNVSKSWCLDFIKELSHWDSWIQDSKYFSCQYSNNRKLAIDRVQAIATLAGYRTSITTLTYNNPNHQTGYRLNIFSGSKSIQGRALITETTDYDGLMYGIFVPTNMLVIRRNGAVSVTGCGNCDARLSHDQIINTNCGHLV